MTRALITFLGRTPKTEDGYRKTSYIFPDGEKGAGTALFASQLIERIEVDEIIILGTTGSVWDCLFKEETIRDNLENLWSGIRDKAENKKIIQADLDRIQPYVSAYFANKEIRLRLIPNGFTEKEQYELLRIMKEETKKYSDLIVDVTHSFRHIPMLGMAAAIYLKYVQKIAINEIWYGFYDPDAKQGYAHTLKGLLGLFDWIDALSKYDYSADYGVFKALLTQENKENVASKMQEAAYYERNVEAVKAKDRIISVNRALKEDPLTGLSTLIQPELEKRMAWAEKEEGLQDRQAHLADIYLRGGDYVRSSIYAFEAFITELVYREKGDPGNFSDRHTAKKNFKLTRYNSLYNDFEKIRNSLVHATRPDNDYLRIILNDEQKLKEIISSFLNKFKEM